ncbi:hypothetical protein PT974_03230 [Cladobotryum mycophilum]|uniref:Uncharacterized protein n=1 Tax=Cladobotryum mycophilum TaxID=491253 RepID=A0ABR0SRU6_9HYPO
MLNGVKCSDIHPWDILIDEQRWPGKIRLIGYIDLFFLIQYSGESRFERGLVIYKDDQVIRDLLRNSGVEAKKINLEPISSTGAEEEEIRRGVIQHGVPRLIVDVIRIGAISTAELVSKVKNDLIGGSSIDVATGKTMTALTAKSPHNLVLSAVET